MSIEKAFDLIFSSDKQTQKLGLTLVKNNFSKSEIDTYTQELFGDVMKLTGLSWDTVVMLPQLPNIRAIPYIKSIFQLRNLKSVMLSNRSLVDINMLSNLSKLKSLVLSSNQITDISALSMLSNLEYLQIDNNLISDITPLANLDKLKTIYMYNNRITNITPLFNLTKLEYLYIDNELIPQEDIRKLKTLLPNCQLYDV